MIKRLLVALLVLKMALLPALAAEIPVPGTNGQVVINSSGLWGATSAPTITGTTLTSIPGHQISLSRLCTSTTGSPSS